MKAHILEMLLLVLGRRLTWRLGRALYGLARYERATTNITPEEEAVQRTVIRFVDRPVIIDIGANIGSWSARALSILEERSCLLLAFEPDKDAIRALRSRFDGDPRVQVVEQAVGSSSGTIDFHIRREADGTNSVVNSLGFEKVVRTVPVNVTTLSDAFNDYAIEHAHLVKVDAEGFDFEILKGARALLEAGRVSVIQFEYNHRWIYSRNYLLDVFTLIKNLPYVLGKLTSTHVEIYQKWHPELERYFESNYLCLHTSALPWFSSALVSWDTSNTLRQTSRTINASVHTSNNASATPHR